MKTLFFGFAVFIYADLPVAAYSHYPLLVIPSASEIVRLIVAERPGTMIGVSSTDIYI